MPVATRARSPLLSRLARSSAFALIAGLGFAASTWGALTISSTATPSFAVALNGTDQAPTYSLAFTVANTGGGNNSGWRVNAAATQFLNGTNAFPTTASSVVTVPNPGSCTGGGCNTPTPSGLVVYPVTLPTTGGVAIYNASANTGKGTNVMTATVRVTAPANIIAGTYTSTVTLQVVSGP